LRLVRDKPITINYQINAECRMLFISGGIAVVAPLREMSRKYPTGSIDGRSASSSILLCSRVVLAHCHYLRDYLIQIRI
jgi:hypothetical protein